MIIPAPILQQTQFILSKLRDKWLYVAKIEELERFYADQVHEIRTAVNVINYEADRVESNGKPDEKNIQMLLRLERLEKKRKEESEPLWQELNQIIKLTEFIKAMNDDTGKALSMFYPLPSDSRNKAVAQPAFKREIADELGIEKEDVGDLLRSGERKCAVFLLKNKLL